MTEGAPNPNSNHGSDQPAEFTSTPLLGDLMLQDYCPKSCDICPIELPGTTCPSSSPSSIPTLSTLPSAIPTLSGKPSWALSLTPSSVPSATVSASPSSVPTVELSNAPSTSNMPTIFGETRAPTLLASNEPSINPSVVASVYPSASLSSMPSSVPSLEPTSYPSDEPSVQPTQALLLTLPPSAGPCLNDLNFTVDNVDIKTCAWLWTAENRDNLCKDADVVMNCPENCGCCCDDNDSLTFVQFSNRARKECSWITGGKQEQSERYLL